MFRIESMKAKITQIRQARKPVRVGWAEDSKRLHKLGEDKLVWPEFANPGDAKLKW
jgi:hypothetical protein